MGLSVGWADLYHYFTPGQRLNITGVTRGTYCLVSVVNPPNGPSQIQSSTGQQRPPPPIRLNPNRTG